MQAALPLDYLESDAVPVAQRPDHLGRVRRVSYSTSGQILQPSSGFISSYKFTLNPYSGCGFACDYCYARFFSRTMEDQEQWGEWVRVKENAVRLVQRAIRSKSERLALHPGDTIYMSSVTDPYQPIEAKLHLSRAILEEILPQQPRLTIQTRSPLVAQDIDILRRFEHLRVNLSIPTDSEDVRLRYEPHAPAIGVRLHTAEKLRAAGIAIGISISPMLPVVDAESFGHRLAALEAAEYGAQWMHSVRGRFAAGTPRSTIDKFAEDNWTEPAYERARDTIAHVLGPSRPLLEGSNGFRPPP